MGDIEAEERAVEALLRAEAVFERPLAEEDDVEDDLRTRAEERLVAVKAYSERLQAGLEEMHNRKVAHAEERARLDNMVKVMDCRKLCKEAKEIAMKAQQSVRLATDDFVKKPVNATKLKLDEAAEAYQEAQDEVERLEAEEKSAQANLRDNVAPPRSE